MPDDIDGLLADDGDDSGDDGAPETDPSAPPKVPKSADKRISDLQSARDKETARANKAEARLKAILAASSDRDTESGTPSDPEVSPMVEMARMFAVQQNPKLAEYGLTESDLTGSTPREIAKSAADLIARFEKIETQVRNKVLADNGMAPELAGAEVLPPDRDFSKMSSDDFKKLMDAAMTGSRL
jgi:hypothetical protein